MFQKEMPTKTFSYVRECNIICIVREGEKKERTNPIESHN